MYVNIFIDVIRVIITLAVTKTPQSDINALKSILHHARLYDELASVKKKEKKKKKMKTSYCEA